MYTYLRFRIAPSSQPMQGRLLLSRPIPAPPRVLPNHLAYHNNQQAFDRLRQLCNFNLTLLTNDNKTASEVAFERNHDEFAKHLEQLSPEMRALREKHIEERETISAPRNDHSQQLEANITAKYGNNMLQCFTCPLTKEIFDDPVVLGDGFTYEKSAIEQWFAAGYRRSPMTNMELMEVNFVPNLVIKQALDEIRSNMNK
mgnify:CR=1 FL=1